MRCSCSTSPFTVLRGELVGMDGAVALELGRIRWRAAWRGRGTSQGRRPAHGRRGSARKSAADRTFLPCCRDGSLPIVTARPFGKDLCVNGRHGHLDAQLGDGHENLSAIQQFHVLQRQTSAADTTVDGGARLRCFQNGVGPNGMVAIVVAELETLVDVGSAGRQHLEERDRLGRNGGFQVPADAVNQGVGISTFSPARTLRSGPWRRHAFPRRRWRS